MRMSLSASVEVRLYTRFKGICVVLITFSDYVLSFVYRNC